MKGHITLNYTILTVSKTNECVMYNTVRAYHIHGVSSDVELKHMPMLRSLSKTRLFLTALFTEVVYVRHYLMFLIPHKILDKPPASSPCHVPDNIKGHV